jgi:two-component system cell cycle sensor histidine kinase/response regulator CckA
MRPRCQRLWRASAGARSLAREGRVARPRILVAEDQAIVAMELEHRLELLGYDVCGVVASADDAIARARETRPDILLFDIRLQGRRDGIDAAHAVQSERPVPVVFLSAYADRTMLERVRALDHSSYLLKPFDERMLQISLDAALHTFRVSMERDREERARRRSEVRLAAILDHSPDAIVSLGPDRRIVVFNRGAERIFGYAADEVLGRTLEILLPEGFSERHEELVERFAGSDEQTRAIGERREISGRRKNGEVFPAEGSLFRTAAGGEVLFSVIFRDISDRKRLESRSVQAQKLEAVGRLAAGVVHDFNNLLSAIQCNAYLASLHAPAEAGRPLDEILASVQRGAALTRQMLAFVRRQPAHALPVDVSLALAAMEGLVRTLAGTGARMRIELEVGAGVAALDTAGLEQIVMNLVVNARDAMPEGGTMTLRTRRHDVEAPREGTLGPIPAGRYVEISVSDTGTGMSPEIAARIFEPFFTTKPLGHGTGLGLMTVAEVLRAHGGHLELVTAPREGSTFRVLLPALDVAPARRPPEHAAVPPGEPLRVLIVDDDDALRSAAARILALAGLSVREAQSPEDALRLASEPDALDVVVSDVRMPSMLGPALVQAIRARRPDVAIVLMSAHEDVAGLGELGEPERRLLLHKPFHASELVERVRFAAAKVRA